MYVVFVFGGQKSEIWAVDYSNDPARPNCKAQNFVQSLPEDIQKSMVRLLKEHADRGPIKNTSKSRLLKHGIYEFKVDKGAGARLLYFVLDDGRTVLTHGFPKPKRAKLNQEIKLARRTRSRVQELGL